MVKSWRLWLLGNAAAVGFGLLTGWWDVTIQTTLVACVGSAFVMPWIDGSTAKEDGDAQMLNRGVMTKADVAAAENQIPPRCGTGR